MGIPLRKFLGIKIESLSSNYKKHQMTPLDSALVLYKTILTNYNHELKKFIAETFGLLHIELEHLRIDLNQLDRMGFVDDTLGLLYREEDYIFRFQYNRKKKELFSEYN
jgi:hypothetical protein